MRYVYGKSYLYVILLPIRKRNWTSTNICQAKHQVNLICLIVFETNVGDNNCELMLMTANNITALFITYRTFNKNVIFFSPQKSMLMHLQVKC